jgi:hypothetical protein
MATTDQLRETLFELESSERQGYVPTKDGNPIGNSGVTIAGGLDLGQHDASSLRGLGLSEGLITQFSPYLGLQGAAAQARLTSSPIGVTSAQESSINNSISQGYWDELAASYQARVGSPITDLTDSQQLALHSAHFNLGSTGLFGTEGAETNLTGQLRAGDITGAANNLYRWHNAGGNRNALDPRRQAEAALFQGIIPHTELSERRDERIGVRDASTTPETNTAYMNAPYHPVDRGFTYQPPPPLTQETPPKEDAGFLSPVNDFINSLFGGDKSGKPQKEITDMIPPKTKETFKSFWDTLFGD